MKEDMQMDENIEKSTEEAAESGRSTALKAGQNAGENIRQNVRDSTGQNESDNAGQNINGSAEESTGQNVRSHTEENTEQNARGSTEENTGQNNGTGEMNDEPVRRVIDENRPVREKNHPDRDANNRPLRDESRGRGERDLRTMRVSEILEDDDWEEYDEEELERPYHHHVRKQRRPREHRLWVRFLKKFMIFAVITGTFAFIFLYGFMLRNVYVTGNYTYSDEEILNILHYNEYPKNTLYFAWKNKDGVTGGVPFVESISVRVKSPSTVYVTVSEKMIIGCIDDSGVYMFFDNTGAVVESSTEKPQDVPLVTGLNLSNLQIGQQLDLNDQSIFKNLYELSVFLKNYDLRVEQIDYNADQSMVLHKGTISVLLGMGSNLEDKINAIKDLEPQLEGLSGTLHLENYDSTKEQINFSKD